MKPLSPETAASTFSSADPPPAGPPRRAIISHRRALFRCGISATLITVTLCLIRPSVLTTLDNAAYDALLRLAGTSAPSDRVVIVDVDEPSLRTHGQWPWPRDHVGRLVDRVRELGATVIGLDIIFAEADGVYRESPARGDAEGRSLSTDESLAKTFRRGGVVLGYALTFDDSGVGADNCVLHPLYLPTVRPARDIGVEPFFRATGAVCPLPALANAAGATGFLNAAPDRDGILRRMPVVLEFDGRLYPGLALAAVMAATGRHGTMLNVPNVNTVSLVLDDQTEVPLDGKSNLLLRFRGEKQTFPYVSATDVLEDRVPSDAFRDKIVFVGTTALGMREVVATPLDTLFAGVEVQATLADNLLERDFIKRHEFEPLINALAVFALGVLTAAVIVTVGLAPGALLGFGGLTAVWLGAGSTLSASGVFVSPVLPTVGFVLGVTAMTVAGSKLERQRADRADVEKTTVQDFVIQSLLALTEVRDAETGRHSRRTQQFTRVLAESLRADPAFQQYLTPERIELLSSLAPLHDIGKVGVPDQILNKSGALTPDELVEMQKHPSYGRDVILRAEREVGIQDDAILSLAKDIVYSHHERWDGTGYPEGLRGSAIPLTGRLIAVVDVYDAAVTRTLYRPPVSHDQAVDMIASQRGTHFDPAIVDALIRVAPKFKSLLASGVISVENP